MMKLAGARAPRPLLRASGAAGGLRRRLGQALSTSLSGAWLGTSATNAAILLFGLATGVLSARLLAPDGRGALAAALFWPQLISALQDTAGNEIADAQHGTDLARIQIPVLERRPRMAAQHIESAVARE